MGKLIHQKDDFRLRVTAEQNGKNPSGNPKAGWQ
jgi:hypothetical protein